MAITITQQPPEISPAYNDIILTVSSNNVFDTFKFKYVFDIYAKQNGAASYTYVGRVKTTPNPSAVGMLDLGRYLENQVYQDMFSGEPFEIGSDTNGWVATGSTSMAKYYILCGEEYATTETGIVQLRNGNGALATSGILTGSTTNVVTTFNGVQQFEDGLLWDGTPYFLTSGRTFLTNSPRTLYREDDEYVTLCGMAGLYNGTQANANNARMYATVYNAAGSLIHTYTSSFTINYTGTDKQMIFGGINLNTIVSGYTSTWNKVIITIGSGGNYENMTIFNKGCPWDKYNPVDVIFLNRLGGWDTFRFYGQKNETLKIDRDTYKRAYGTWSSETYSYNTYERGTSNIKTDLILEGTVESDFINRDTVNWLGELLTSSQIFLIKDGVLKPINITDSNFNLQLRGNKKLRQVGFKYEYSTEIRTQQQ